MRLGQDLHRCDRWWRRCMVTNGSQWAGLRTYLLNTSSYCGCYSPRCHFPEPAREPNLPLRLRGEVAEITCVRLVICG